MPENLFGGFQRIAYQLVAVEIYFMHIYGGYLVVVICGVVVNSLCAVAAGGVVGELIRSFTHLAAALLLLYRAENMK